MVTQIKVSIDGQAVDFCEVVFQFQNQAFPGGSHYELVIPRSNISNKIWSVARFENSSSPSEGLARDWFYWLQAILSKQPKDNTIRNKYVLNNICEIRVSDSGVAVNGECSPFVR